MNAFGIQRKDAVKEPIRQRRRLTLKKEDANITNQERNVQKCQVNVYGEKRNVLKDKEVTESVLVVERVVERVEVVNHTNILTNPTNTLTNPTNILTKNHVLTSAPINVHTRERNLPETHGTIT